MASPPTVPPCVRLTAVVPNNSSRSPSKVSQKSASKARLSHTSPVKPACRRAWSPTTSPTRTGCSSQRSASCSGGSAPRSVGGSPQRAVRSNGCTPTSRPVYRPRGCAQTTAGLGSPIGAKCTRPRASHASSGSTNAASILICAPCCDLWCRLRHWPTTQPTSPPCSMAPGCRRPSHRALAAMPPPCAAVC